MLYGCQICGQVKNNDFRALQVLQNNAIRLISFEQDFRDHVSHHFLNLNIIKLTDMVVLQNLLLVYDFFNNIQNTLNPIMDVPQPEKRNLTVPQ